MFETLLEKYTIEVVANRTKISKRNLEKLREGDFSGFTRPQAIGFVRILEREFGEDFSDLRDEIDAAMSGSGSPIQEPIFVRESGAAPKRSKGWLVAAVVIVALLLGFYLFRQDFSAPAHEESLTPAAASAPAETPKHAPKSVESAPPQTQPQTAASEERAEQKPPAVEANATQNAQTAEPAKEKKAEEPYVPLEPVAVTPTVKLWFGIIDLKSGKRTAKVTARPYEIDSHGKKLLVTGHGRFEISDAFGNLFKYNDAKKHYFLIDDGLVREIDAAEFRRLNGGKGW